MSWWRPFKPSGYSYEIDCGQVLRYHFDGEGWSKDRCTRGRNHPGEHTGSRMEWEQS